MVGIVAYGLFIVDTDCPYDINNFRFCGIMHDIEPDFRGCSDVVAFTM